MVDATPFGKLLGAAKTDSVSKSKRQLGNRLESVRFYTKRVRDGVLRQDGVATAVQSLYRRRVHAAAPAHGD